MVKAKLERERITSQEGMDELQHDLEQALAERDEATKQADEDMERMQNDVQLFQVMNTSKRTATVFRANHRDTLLGMRGGFGPENL